MDHQVSKKHQLPNRFGFHYFPDYLHYSEEDAKRWSISLDEMDAKWLVVRSPSSYAIPESFIGNFSSKGTNLVLDFNFPMADEINWYDLELLLSSYGKWGAKFAILNQFPNQQCSWPIFLWGKPNLIENVVHQFIRFGNICLEKNIRPVFPLLTPGGDYWDLAFLKTALEQIKNDAPQVLINNFILSAAAWGWSKPLDWGAGAQSQWPLVKPYKIPNESQNQLGFRTYEWYLHISQAVFGKSIPILLMQAGIENNLQDSNSALNPIDLEKLLMLKGLLRGKNIYDSQDKSHLLQPICSDVIGCCFYILSSDSPDLRPCQWYLADGQRLPPAQSVFIRGQNKIDKKEIAKPNASPSKINFKHKRYVFFPEELHPDSTKIIELLYPYIQKFRPMVGFSISEAQKSAVILAIAPAFGEEPSEFEHLKSCGSLLKIIRPSEIPAYIQEQTHAI